MSCISKCYHLILMKKVIITGSGGLIGSECARKLGHDGRLMRAHAHGERSLTFGAIQDRGGE